MTRRWTEHGKGAALVIVSPVQTDQPGEHLLTSLERVNQAHHVTLKKLAQ